MAKKQSVALTVLASGRDTSELSWGSTTVRGGFEREMYHPRSSVVVKALCYEPEGRGFETRWGEFFNLPNPSRRTRPWS
jgi:hypothetical protein